MIKEDPFLYYEAIGNSLLGEGFGFYLFTIFSYYQLIEV